MNSSSTFDSEFSFFNERNGESEHSLIMTIDQTDEEDTKQEQPQVIPSKLSEAMKCSNDSAFYQLSLISDYTQLLPNSNPNWLISISRVKWQNRGKLSKCITERIKRKEMNMRTFWPDTGNRNSAVKISKNLYIMNAPV